MMHELWVLLQWLYANVLGNLVASAIWGVPTVLHLKQHINRKVGQ